MEKTKINEVFKIWKKHYENNVILLNQPDNTFNQNFFDEFCLLDKTEQKEVTLLINNHKKKRTKELLMICVN